MPYWQDNKNSSPIISSSALLSEHPFKVCQTLNLTNLRSDIIKTKTKNASCMEHMLSRYRFKE